MKIKKKAKGLVDYSHIYNPQPTDEAIEAWIEEQIEEEDEEFLRIEEEMHEAEQREREENARARELWEQQAKENFKRIRDVPGAVGQRLTHLFEIEKIEKASFARQIGVGRTTLHRYLSGETTPNEAKLHNIIVALDMDEGDFCYEPENFDKWKENLEASARRANDIFKLRDEFLAKFDDNTFTYRYHGTTLRLPRKHYLVLKMMLESSFHVLDLLKHDLTE